MGMFFNFVQYMTGADPGIFVRGGSNLREKFDKQKQRKRGRFSVYSA